MEKSNEILDKILNTEIHVLENFEDPNEYISKKLGIKDNYITSENIIGYATTRPIYKNESIETKSIIYLFNDIDPDNPKTWSVIIHELCHIIKMKGFSIYNNEIHHITGF